MDTTLLDPTPMGTQDLMLMRIHTDITILIINWSMARKKAASPLRTTTAPAGWCMANTSITLT